MDLATAVSRSSSYGAVALFGMVLAFAFFVVQRLPTGLPRLLALCPFLPAFFVLPGWVISPNARGSVAFVLCWTCPSKLLLLCFDLFVDSPSWLQSHVSHFLAAMLLPVCVKGPAKKQAGTCNWRGLMRYTLATALIFNLYRFRDLIPLPFLYLMHFATMFISLQLGHCMYACFMHALFRVDLQPAFHDPFNSASLAEFWGHRWNLTATTLLRATVYKPVLRLLPPQGGEAGKTNDEEHKRVHYMWARALALCSTFLASGLIHELIFFHLVQSDRPPTWEVTAFFALHGVATSAEVALKQAIKHRPHLIPFEVPRGVRVLFTLGFLYASAVWLFLPPLCRSHTDSKAIAEYLRLQTWVVSTLKHFVKGAHHWFVM